MLCIFVLSCIIVGMVDSTTGDCCTQISESNRATTEHCCKPRVHKRQECATVYTYR